MKRTSRWGPARVATVTVLALVVGVLASALSSGAPAVAATDGQMVFPASGNIQSKVGDGCRNNYRAHDGIDITPGGSGAPIVAAYDGVIKARTSNSGYGNYTDVEHPGGYVTRYAHLASPGAYGVGTRVSRGQQIGVMGKTGATSAIHLHFEVRLKGAVYTPINQGFTCLANVTRGGFIPLFFPGMGSAPAAQYGSADFTGDAKADLVIVSGSGDLRLRSGNGAASYRAPVTVSASWADGRRHITHADFNGDRKGDLLAARSDGSFEFHAGNGAGAFRTPVVSSGTGWYAMLHMASGADYNGDGKQDVLGVSPDGILTIYRGDGKGGFAKPHQTLGGGWQGFHFLVGGDFDNDGRGDIVAVSDAGALVFYPGGINGFGARRVVGDGWQEYTALTGGVDYNSDGIADLIARTPSGDIYLYPGIGNGAFKARSLVGSGWGEYLHIE